MAPLLALLLAMAACGSDKHENASPPKTTQTTAKASGPFAIGVRTVTFIDRSRPNNRKDTQPGAPRRTIVTNIWYPAEGPAGPNETPDAKPAAGRFPLVLLSHGRTAEPQQYAASLRLWARAGYVVAGLRHPLTSRLSPYGSDTEDIQNQPADLSFVITRMRAEFPKQVDGDHVAVVGHSSGAITALAAGFNTCCDDDRIDAVVLESTIAAPFTGGKYFDDLPHTPVLFFHGDADPTFPYAAGHAVFEQAHSPKFFVTINGGTHSNPYRDGPPDFHLVAQASLDFFDRYLKNEKDALDRLRRDVAGFPFGKLEAVP
jgi:alpha-beta hydrolase superfamily lysophospholipase